IKHQHQIEGINSRLDGLQAAILSAKLPYILEWTEKRIEKAKLYDKYLQGIAGIKTPVVRPGSKHTWHLYVVLAESRDQLKEFLKEQGVETFIHYPTPLPSLPCYKYLGYTPADFPVATKLQGQILSLPIYPEITDDMIEYVADAIRRFYDKR
ncbi:MAG TPA: DegT/DnrJ/EryC1/StrS family aminotransferase, partial [Chitinophagaceae bacterium]|nr:DegT/DnrJ/EryC1/StrS family aminotransferase [Chitinophagaceae bacterium]